MSTVTVRQRSVAALVLALVAGACVGASAHPDTAVTASTVADATTTTAASTSTGVATTSTTMADPIVVTTTQPPTTTTRAPLEPSTYESVSRYHWIGNFSSYTARGLARWESSVPGIQDLRITSSLDDAEQPLLWLPPEGDGDRPLLVILHSWSSNYLQHAGIPYALWAQENGWAVIAPDYRGRNDDADAIGSELAVQDVVDAIDFAVAQGGVDATRVFAVGYSGGGMMGLLLAGRHPDKVTAVAAWGAVYDLIDFYQQSRNAGRHYYWEIAAACGGDPRREGFEPYQECLRRSPMTYLDTAREEGVPVYLAQGLWDGIVSPRHSARAYNQLADPEDRLTDDQIASLGQWRVPIDLIDPLTAESYFEDGDPQVLVSIESAAVKLVYFQASHDMVYQATMRWFASDPG